MRMSGCEETEETRECSYDPASRTRKHSSIAFLPTIQAGCVSASSISDPNRPGLK
jgi:hypothetical protein